MLKKFIDSVLIIDDKEDEVKGLIEVFEQLDVWTTFFTPPIAKKEIEELSLFRNRKLIFIDLRLDESKSTKDNISTVLRPLFQSTIGKDFGSYGIVMWTRNTEHIDDFKEKVSIDAGKYTLPLFIIGLNKQKYLKNGYYEIIDDLHNEIKENTAANFFVNWGTLVQEGRDKAIQSIFDLVNGYTDIDNKNLEYLLFHIAKNHIGLHDDALEEHPLYQETYKAFLELLAYEVSIKCTHIPCSLFGNIDSLMYQQSGSTLTKTAKGEYRDDSGNNVDIKKLYRTLETEKSFCKVVDKSMCNEELIKDVTKRIEDKENIIKEIDEMDQKIYELFSLLNTNLLIDQIPPTDLIMPGNIYEVLVSDHLLFSKEKNKKDIPIMIELTPPCDFANKKGSAPKFIGGFITNFSDRRIRSLASTAIYTESFPLYLNEKLSIMAFDFRYISIISEDEVKDESKYKLLYRAKDKLFADILQKMSSYTARLGLSIIR